MGASAADLFITSSELFVLVEAFGNRLEPYLVSVVGHSFLSGPFVSVFGLKVEPLLVRLGINIAAELFCVLSDFPL